MQNSHWIQLQKLQGKLLITEVIPKDLENANESCVRLIDHLWGAHRFWIDKLLLET